MPSDQTSATTTTDGPIALRRRKGTGVNRFPNRDKNSAGGNQEDEATGIFAGLALRGQQQVDVRVAVEIEVARIAPHPYNDPARSKPQRGNPKWDELVESVRTLGVQIPAKLVSRAAFLAARPETESLIGAAEYVAIYGHRRRAATIEADKPTLLSVIDDDVMENDGDLVALTTENLGREDFSELAEARLFARWSEQVGLGQRAIADKLGVNQGTISRRLALLLLGPEATAAVEEKRLTSTVGAVLAGKLPYGPPRGWQKNPDPEQEQPQRLAEQSAALALILERNMSANAAADLVLAEKASRAKASKDGLRLVDPEDEFGGQHARHRLYAEQDVQTAADRGDLVAAIDAEQGTLAYYTTSLRAPEELEAEAQQQAREVATQKRRKCCQQLAVSAPSKDTLTDVLVTQRLLNLAPAGSVAWELAHQWLSEVDESHRSAKQLMRAAGETVERSERHRLAWLVALATYEIRAAEAENWGPAEKAYLSLLAARGDYSPTAWEQAALDRAAS